MNRLHVVLAVLPALCSTPLWAGDAEVKSAQSAIDGQLKAFLANDNAKAYSYAAPNIKSIFPTLDSFMHMVENAYQPVWHPQSYAFGKVEESSPTTVIQEVMVVGPNGKNFKAVYKLELQPDGMFRIVSVSLKASNSLSA